MSAFDPKRRFACRMAKLRGYESWRNNLAHLFWFPAIACIHERCPLLAQSRHVRAELQPKVGSSWFVRELFGLAGRRGIRANRKLKPSTTTQITTPSNATAEINCPLNAEISVALPLNSQTAAARFNAKRISAASMRPRPPFSTDHSAARA